MKENLKEFLKTYKPKEDEFVKNDMIYCKNCLDEKIFVVSNNEFYYCSGCTCKSQEWKKQEEQRKKEQRMRYIETLKDDSLLSNKMRELTFENIDKNRPESFLKAFKLCVNYCNNFEENLKNGNGLYLYGGSGLGKTMLTACIANFYLNKLVPVLFTSFFEITRTLKAIYDGQSKLGEDAYIERLANIELLIIDDIGSELKQKNNDFFNNTVFQILDKRVKNSKSTIFTSNLGLKAMTNKGLDTKNAERILELCKNNFVELTGKSYRLNFAN